MFQPRLNLSRTICDDQASNMTHSADFIRIITERGYMHQATSLEGLDKVATEKSIPAYIGFDCTADSLHVGSLVQIMMLRVLQQTGHKPIVLMGGGTTKVGDPSGKDSQRPLLSDQDIENNKNGIKKIFEKYLTFGDRPGDAVMVDNAEWLDELGYISFLRNYGVHFSVNRITATTVSVKIRFCVTFCSGYNCMCALQKIKCLTRNI